MEKSIKLQVISTIFIIIQSFCIADLDSYPGEKPNIWNTIAEKVLLVDQYFDVDKTVDVDKTLTVNQTCTVCQLAFDALIRERRYEMTDVQLFAEIDYFGSKLSIVSDRVLQGVIPPHLDIVSYIIDNDKKINGKKICGLILQNIDCDAGDNFNWTIDIPGGTTIDKPQSHGSDTFGILHLSDIHYDPNYTENKTNKCGEPLCCQSDQADAATAGVACGHFGEYSHADSPMELVKETLKFAANKSKEFDYVYFTGDMVSHRVWSTSVQNNTKAMETMFDEFSKYFSGIPIYPVLGNHESHPVNAYGPSEGIDENLSTKWLYQLALKKWSEWLPSEEVKETVLKGGFYTVMTKRGLRVIVLNSNVCSVENWWLLYKDTDPYGQLKWLVETLKSAEEHQESVHILSHIPTNSCLKTWSREYNRIIQRFANTITGQFYGHSHTDEFYIYYGNDSKPTNVAWNGASVVPDKANPNFKLYTVDSKNFEVIDAASWTFNLTQANQGKLEWYVLYNMKKDFGLKSLSPSDMDVLVTDFTKNSTLFESYYKFYHRNSDAVPMCSNDCKKNKICEIVNTVPGDRKKCQELTELVA